MAKRHLEQYDSSGNRQEIYLNDDEVIVEGGQTLGEKLDEIDEALGEAGSGSVNGVQVGETTYRPNQNGVVDLSTPLDLKVDKEQGKGLSSNDYTTQEREKLAGLSNYDDTALQAAVVSLQNALAALVGGADVQGAIDTFNEVVAFLSGISSSDTLAAKLATLVPQTRTVNGKALSGNVTIGMSDIPGLVEAIAAAGSGAVSVTTNQDGTFVIHVGSTDYTINLNHTHENMAKLVVCDESDLPSTLDPATIYAITDSGETEIEKLIIRGMEFAGGIPDTGLPQVYKPISGSVIDLGSPINGGASKVVSIKARNLTNNLTVTVGTGLTVTYNGTTASSVTIPKADAILGADVTVAYTGTAELDDGAMTISHGNDMLASYTVTAIRVWEVLDLTQSAGRVDVEEAWLGQSSFGVQNDKRTAIVDLSGCEKLSMTASETSKFFYVPLVSVPDFGTVTSDYREVAYANYVPSGVTGRIEVAAGATVDINIPSSWNYIAIGLQSASSDPMHWLPSYCAVK